VSTTTQNGCHLYGRPQNIHLTLLFQEREGEGEGDRYALRASIISFSHLTVRIIIIYLYLVRGERRRLSSHAKPTRARTPRHFMRLNGGPYINKVIHFLVKYYTYWLFISYRWYDNFIIAIDDCTIVFALRCSWSPIFELDVSSTKMDWVAVRPICEVQLNKHTDRCKWITSKKKDANEYFFWGECKWMNK
jgi:hypothetical protein